MYEQIQRPNKYKQTCTNQRKRNCPHTYKHYAHKCTHRLTDTRRHARECEQDYTRTGISIATGAQSTVTDPSSEHTHYRLTVCIYSHVHSRSLIHAIVHFVRIRISCPSITHTHTHKLVCLSGIDIHEHNVVVPAAAASYQNSGHNGV